MTYNVFVVHPQTLSTLASVHADKPYDASAAVNMWLDLGMRVESDLWADYDPTAMIYPGVQLTTITREDTMTTPEQTAEAIDTPA